MVVLEMKSATLFMMLLVSDKATRNFTFTIFDWMESGAVLFHHVMGEENENNLANIFEKEMEKDKMFKSFSTDKAMKRGALVAHIREYLSDYKRRDLDGWNEVSRKFALARSFCFFRLLREEDFIDE